MNLFSPWAFYGEGDGGPSRSPPTSEPRSEVTSACKTDVRGIAPLCFSPKYKTREGPYSNVAWALLVKRRYFRCRVSESKLATKYLGTSTGQTRRESDVSHRSTSHTLTDLRARGRGVPAASSGPRGHLRLRCQRCAVPGSVPRPARPWAFSNPEGGPRGKGRRQRRGSSRSPHVPGGQTRRCVCAHTRTPHLHSVSSSGSRRARG